MNTRKLMAVALCAAACVSTTAFAEDDFGIESASPVKIADPVNPQPGMQFRGYCIGIQFKDKFQQLGTTLESAAAVKSTVVKTEQFSFEPFLKEIKIDQGVWEGFLKCKRTAKCTIVLKQKRIYDSGFLLFVNGKRVIAAREQGQGAVDVELKVGFNHIKIITQTAAPLEVFLGPTGSTKPPKLLSPMMMFHDEKPEEDVI